MATSAREFMQMDIVILSIILYALLGKLSDVLALMLEKKDGFSGIRILIRKKLKLEVSCVGNSY